MSIFGNIMSAIFGNSAGSQSAAGASAQSGGSRGPTEAAQRTSGTASGSASTAPSTAGAQSGGAAQTVDVEAVLTDLAEERDEKLDWRRSIVDLMKLLDLDSSLAARKELAKELHYTGDMNDSAAMNVWLHKQVMKKLAENGGKVPAELRA